jgi:pSer/pThr/pTyr-binding forkhead associated (FHA) protein
MRIQLEVIDGPMVGRSFSFLGPMTVTIGRTERSDYVLEADVQISSLHVQLQCEGNTCLLRDMNSSNGTWVNGERVSKRELHDADLIRIGQTTLRVRLSGSANGSPSAPRAQAADAPAARETRSQRVAETTTDPAPSTLTPATQPPRESRPGARSRPSIRLHVQSAAGRERTAWIRPGEQLTVGRSESSDIMLPNDLQLSPVHFAVAFDGVRCELRAVDHAESVAVNGVSLQAAQLHDGDEIRAGQSCFRVTYGQAPTIRLNR